MSSRTCAHCGDPIPDAMKSTARFCKASCRVNHHVANRPPPVLTDDVHLNRTEAGLLLDAEGPWAVHHAGRGGAHPIWSYVAHGKTPPQEVIDKWRAHCASEARAKRVQRAWRRLAALGLVRVGRLHGTYGQTVIERTDAGTALLGRRHNELGAIAERGNGVLTSTLAWDGARLVFWRDGGMAEVRGV